MKTLIKNSRKCKYCGKKILDHQIRNNKLIRFAFKNGTCLECAKWLLTKKKKNLEVINGIAYIINRVTSKRYGKYLGNKGITRYMIKKDGTVKVSNDIWEIGKVPSHFLDLYPNTGWWIDEKNGDRALKKKFSCQNKICFDRYHCLRYDYKQEFANGPYNMIPKNWVTGKEKCKFFVNILKIENFYDYFDTSDPMLYEETDK